MENFAVYLLDADTGIIVDLFTICTAHDVQMFGYDRNPSYHVLPIQLSKEVQHELV